MYLYCIARFILAKKSFLLVKELRTVFSILFILLSKLNQLLLLISMLYVLNYILLQNLFEIPLGIYVHKTGKFEGEHAVKLIGWGVWKNTEYWLAMNSFGNYSWGKRGTFMVPRSGKDNTEFGYAIISPILMGTGTSKINFFEQKLLIVFILFYW